MPKLSASSLECGDHICALYSRPNECAHIVAGFLADGLKRGERCWYVATGSEGAAVRTALRKRGVNVDADSRRGAISIVRETYVVDGEFNPEHTVQVFSDAIEQALKDGYTGFRGCRHVVGVAPSQQCTAGYCL